MPQYKWLLQYDRTIKIEPVDRNTDPSASVTFIVTSTLSDNAAVPETVQFTASIQRQECNESEINLIAFASTTIAVTNKCGLAKLPYTNTGNIV